MDVVAQRKEVLFTNLLALGFDVADVEKKHRVKCDKNMFTLPNRKMFEIVSYFLFTKLNEVGTMNYSLKWPLFDKSQQEQFRKLCYTYLCSISKASIISFPRMVPSLLNTFGGDRFCELYFAFSTHVVHATLLKNNNVEVLHPPCVTKDNRSQVIETLQISTIMACEKFTEVSASSKRMLELFLKISRSFTAYVQKLKSKTVLIKSLGNSKIESLASIYPGEINTDAPDFHRKLQDKFDERKEKIIECWTKLQDFFLSEENLWNILGEYAKENCKKFCLDVATLGAHDIASSPEDFLEKLNKVSDDFPQENKKLHILRFLNLFVTYLECYLESIKKNNMGQVEISDVDSPEDLIESLKDLRLLKENLTDVIHDISSSVEDFRMQNFLNSNYEEDSDVTMLINPTCLRNRELGQTSSSVFSDSDEAYTLSYNTSNFPMEVSSEKDKHEFPSSRSPFMDHQEESSGCSTSSLDSPFSESKIEPKEDSLLKKIVNAQIPNIEEPSKTGSASGFDFSDIDSDASKSSCNRLSYLIEDSLNSMTLSDCSLLDF